MNGKKDIIFLVGFMASGKTTVGKLLAKKLGVPFYDTDEIIEKETKKSIQEIFKIDGEGTFREIESRVLKDIINSDIISRGVIATGGGMPCFNNNMSLMNNRGITVYLKTPIDDIVGRIKDADKRPVFKREMKNGELIENIQRVMISREPYYNMADFIIENNSARTPLEVVDDLIDKLRKIKHGNH